MGGLTDQLKDILRENGCFFVRQGRGDHEIWESPVSGKRFPVDSNIKSRHTANAVAEAGGPAKDVLTSESVDIWRATTATTSLPHKGGGSRPSLPLAHESCEYCVPDAVQRHSPSKTRVNALMAVHR